MRVIGYARVSTEEQSTEGISLAAQVARLRAYATAFGLDLVEVVEDGGFSAKSLERPGIKHALELLRSGEADALLVAKLDRLSRSVADLDMLVRVYFGDRGQYNATLLSVEQQIDTRTASGRMVLNILMSVAQGERELISERTRAALAHLKEQGVKLGRPALVVTEEAEVQNLRLMMALKADGLSLAVIAARLNEAAIPTKRGGRWHASTVKYCLDVIAPQSGLVLA